MPRKDEIRILPHMPGRLRELRQELGWSLADVAQHLGLTQRSVVSNWEATNQRRRIPGIDNILEMQRWYGVSLDYLVGEPGAERDSPAVRRGKEALRSALSAVSDLQYESPSSRARIAVRIAGQVAPEVFFSERIAAFLLLDIEDLKMRMSATTFPDELLTRLAVLLGVSKDWYYTPNPGIQARAEDKARDVVR